MENPRVDSVDPEHDPNRPPKETPNSPDLIAQMPRSVHGNQKTALCKPDQTPLWKMILETGAVFVGLYVAGIYHDQLVVMQGQLGEIVKQYPELKKSADAAVTASKAATQTLNAIGKQFVLDQRPYIVETCCILASAGDQQLQAPIIGKHLGVDIHIRNNGKTPAFHVVYHHHMTFGEQVLGVHADPMDSPATLNAGAILNQGDPGIFFTAWLTKHPFATNLFNIDDSELLNWDGSNIEVFGRTIYEDSFGNRYCTPFAHWWLHGNTWVNIETGTIVSKKPPIANQQFPQMCPAGIPF
jgi:hypothetical protein